MNYYKFKIKQFAIYQQYKLQGDWDKLHAIKSLIFGNVDHNIYGSRASCLT